MKKIALLIICFVIFTPQNLNAEVVHIPLDKAVELALDNNLDLKSKREEIEALKQDVKIANALKNPEFQSNILMGKVTRGNSSQIGLALPVEIGKRGVRKKVALSNLKIAENELRQKEHNLKIEVMRAYFNVLYVKSVVSILQEREKLFKSMKTITDQKSKTSSNYAIDVLQNNMKYQKQLVFLNKAKANLLSAQFELNNTMNIKDNTVMYDTIETSLFANNLQILDINLLPYTDIENIAMKYSYALAIANSEIEKSDNLVKLAKHQRIPDITLSGGYAYQTAHQTKTEALPGGYVGANLNIPILYSFTPEIKKSKIILERSKTDKDSFENHLKYSLKEEYNDFKYAKTNLKHYQEILKDSNAILETYKKRYEKGQASLLNLLQVENAHQETIREYINAIQVYYDAYLDLMQNVGNDILITNENTL